MSAVLSAAPAAVQLWAIVRVADQRVAIPTTQIAEMVSAPPVSPVPHAPEAVRGLSVLRDRTILMVDLRERLGLPTREEETEDLVALLTAREDDHRRWLGELEASTREGRPFTLSLDPDACAFGRWYHTFQAPTLELDGQMKRFDAPHRALHAVAAQVVERARSGRTDEALAIIGATRRTTLHALIGLFDGARRLVQSSARTIAIVTAGAGRPLGLLVDAVEGVDHLREDSLSALPTLAASGDEAVLGTARTSRDDRIVIPLDLERLGADYARVST